MATEGTDRVYIVRDRSYGPALCIDSVIPYFQPPIWLQKPFRITYTLFFYLLSQT